MSMILIPTMIQTSQPYRRMDRRCLYPDPVGETVADILQDMLPLSRQRSHARTDIGMFSPRRVQMYHRPQRGPRRVEPWEHVIHLPGFEPSHIDVKIDGENFVVHARRHVQNGDNYDVTETRRSVRIPDTVNKDTIRCYLRHDEKMVISAPRISENNECLDKTTESSPGNCAVKKRKASPLTLADLLTSLLFDDQSLAKKEKKELPVQSSVTSEQQTRQLADSDGNRQACDPTRPVRKQVEDILTVQVEPETGTLSEATPTKEQTPQVEKGEGSNVTNTTTDAKGASGDIEYSMFQKRQEEEETNSKDPASVVRDHASVIRLEDTESIHTEDDQNTPAHGVTEKEDTHKARSEMRADAISTANEAVDKMAVEQETELTIQNDEHGLEPSMEPSDNRSLVVQECDEGEVETTEQECIIEEPCETEKESSEAAPSEDKTEIIERDGKKVFQIVLDISDYKPEDISVRCDGHVLYVDGKITEEDREFTVSMEIHRKYTLPMDAHAELAKATMTDGGRLRITVPFASGVTDVPIVPIIM